MMPLVTWLDYFLPGNDHRIASSWLYRVLLISAGTVPAQTTRTTTMSKLLLILLCLCGIGVAQPAAPADDSPALTIYNQNFFIARERFPMSLVSGVNHINYSGVAAHLEPDSVMLRDPGGRSLQILEQSYRNDPISQELLLSFYEGKTIDFSVGRTAEGKDVTVTGKVIRSGYIPSSYFAQNYQQPVSTQPIIEVDGVLHFGLPGQPLFPALSKDSILKPTLNWQLETNEPGSFNAEISYVSSGMSWQSDYNLVVSDGTGGKFDLLDVIGWITMRNQSGKTFENAQIKLMAGDVNEIQAPTVTGRVYAAAKAVNMADEMAPVVREKSFDEFHLYTLQRPATLRDQETKQVEFVRSTGAHAQRVYVYDGAQLAQYGYYPDQLIQDPSYGTVSNTKIWVMEEFKNSEANHLGIPLPKGRLRFYRRDDDGHLEFIGENTIDHTPKDEMIRVYTGNSFDVVGERKRTEFHIESSQRWMDESFEIHVRNHKKEAVNLRVVEHLFRCHNWKLIQQSHKSEKKDAQTVEFPVTVAANGEQVITYSVHYTW